MTPRTPTAPQRPVVLVGIDGGAGSASVLRSAATLAQLGQNEIVIAHVVECPQLSGEGYLGLDESTLTDVEADLFPDVVEALIGTSVTWTLITVIGNPATELMRLAEERHAGAIVVGADTPGWTNHLRRISSGSVPSRLAHEQRLPVVVVPEGCSRRHDPARAQDHQPGRNS